MSDDGPWDMRFTAEDNSGPVSFHVGSGCCGVFFVIALIACAIVSTLNGA